MTETDNLAIPALDTQPQIADRFMRVRGFAAALLTVPAMLAGCANEQEQPPAAEVAPATSPADGETSQAEGATFEFDDLGGGESTIHVYPGVTEKQADRRPNGTFNHGDVVEAICRAVGRTVPSDPTVGERNVESNKWVGIIGSPGVDQFATLTYGKISKEDYRQLPKC